MEGDGAAAAESAREDRAEKLQKTEPEPEPAEYSDEDRARSDAIKADANAAFSASNFAKAVAESNVKLEKERESLRGVRTDVAQRCHTRHPRAAGAATAAGALSSRMRGAATPASAGQLRGPFAPNVVCTT